MSIFIDRSHAQRWAEVVDITGAVESDLNKVNTAFGASLYLLTAVSTLSESLSDYVHRGWIDFDSLIENTFKSLSSGEKVIVLLAGNLYNGAYKCTPSDFLSKCDETMVTIALTAIELRANRIELETVFT